MGGVLRKETPRDKYLKYQNFITHFHFHYSWNVLATKIGQIYIHYKIGQSGCIPPKIKCEILAHKGSPTTRATPVRLSRLLKPRTNGTTEPPGVNDDRSRSSGKSNPLQTRLVGRWGGRHNNEQSCQKQKKIQQQKWKNWKMCWGAGQRIYRQLSKLRF